MVVRSVMRLLESKKTLRESIPRLAAEDTAALNANASATRVEETEQGFEEKVPAGADIDFVT